MGCVEVGLWLRVGFFTGYRPLFDEFLRFVLLEFCDLKNIQYLVGVFLLYLAALTCLLLRYFIFFTARLKSLKEWDVTKGYVYSTNVQYFQVFICI